MKITTTTLKLVLLMSFLETIAQTSLRYYHSNDRKIFFVFTVILYGVIMYILSRIYDYDGMGIANALWSGLTVISIAYVGYRFYGEEIFMRDFIGYGMIIGGMILASI